MLCARVCVRWLNNRQSNERDGTHTETNHTPYDLLAKRKRFLNGFLPSHTPRSDEMQALVGSDVTVKLIPQPFEGFKARAFAFVLFPFEFFSILQFIVFIDGRLLGADAVGCLVQPIRRSLCIPHRSQTDSVR